MRAFVLILLAAFLNATTTVAMAGQPFNPITSDLPSAINSDLPDLSGPANGILDKQQQYELGYSTMLQLRQEGGHNTCNYR